MKPSFTGSIRAAALAWLTRCVGSAASALSSEDFFSDTGFSCPGKGRTFGIETTLSVFFGSFSNTAGTAISS